MDVLHALWVSGGTPGRGRAATGLALWGEDASRPVKSPSQALRTARPHPFAVPATDLAAACGGEPGQVILALPSLFVSPLDSADLVRTRPRPAATAAPKLTAWSVPVTVLTPAEAGWFLAGEPGEALDDVRMAGSVAYFRALASFAEELADRGRFVPCITDEGDGLHRARWRPLIQGPGAAFVADAATAMPPVVRAIVPDVDDLRGLDPAQLVEDIVSALTDAAVRDRLAEAGCELGPVHRARGRASALQRAAEAWLTALTSDDPVIDASPRGIEPLRDALRPWDEFGASSERAAHLVLRVRDPGPEDGAQPGAGGVVEKALDPTVAGGVADDALDPTAVSGEPAPDTPWRIEFALQSSADPSLVVGAAQIWAGTSGLERWFETPDQTLLAELARASAVYAPIAAALRQPAPTGLDLTNDEAYDFLTKEADLLNQAGIVVNLPGWWVRRPSLGLRGHASPAEAGGVAEGWFTAETLYDFSWQMTLEGEPLTEDEMEALVTAKSQLVRLRGAWIAFDPERVRRGLEIIRAARLAGEQRTARDIIALALGRGTWLDGEVVSVGAEGSLGAFLDGRMADAVALVDPPAWFTATLRPYQQRGLAWLAFLARLGLGACLADDMGLGKTVQILALEALDKEAAAARPTLVVCPVSMVGTWQREAARFAPELRVGLHYGPERPHGEALSTALANLDLVVTTYQVLIRDADELAGRDWRRVVADEAQNVKNSETRSARALARVAGGQRVALTGTPVENKLAELRSILDFCNPGFLGSPEVFRARFANPVERTGDSAAAARLRAMTRPFILRRLKTDRSIIDDLPDKIETRQTCFLSPEQASLYQAVVDDMMGRIAVATGIERRGLVLATLMKLKQVCNHPAQFLHDASPIGHRSGKIARLDEIADEILAEDGKALIFTQFTEFGDMLVRHLSAKFNRSVAYLHGQVPKRRRDEIVGEFQSDDGPSLFVLSLKAGGTGLTLTNANHVIHVDRWWNPAVENQATDRAFRIGQRRSVQVHTFVTAGTLEERIDAMIEQKKALADLVVGDGEGWLTELSTAELRDVFALSKEALGE